MITCLWKRRKALPMKLDLLTNVTIVDDAIRFVSKSNENIKPSNEDDKEEPNEPNYDEKEDKLEVKQEKQTREISAIITNQVF
jgi:hypothetical protein